MTTSFGASSAELQMSWQDSMAVLTSGKVQFTNVIIYTVCANHPAWCTRNASFNVSRPPTGDVASKRPACPCLQDSPCPEAALFGHVCRSGSARGGDWSWQQVLARAMPNTKCSWWIAKFGSPVAKSNLPMFYPSVPRQVLLRPMPKFKCSCRWHGPQRFPFFLKSESLECTLSTLGLVCHAACQNSPAKRWCFQPLTVTQQ